MKEDCNEIKSDKMASRFVTADIILYALIDLSDNTEKEVDVLKEISMNLSTLIKNMPGYNFEKHDNLVQPENIVIKKHAPIAKVQIVLPRITIQGGVVVECFPQTQPLPRISEEAVVVGILINAYIHVKDILHPYIQSLGCEEMAVRIFNDCTKDAHTLYNLNDCKKFIYNILY